MTPIRESSATDPWQIIAELQRKLDTKTAECDEALAQQTATAEVLQVINSSPGDLAPVFDAVLDKAMRLCEASFGHVRRYDGELFQFVAVRATPQVAKWVSEHTSGRGESAVTYERLLRGESVVHIPDVKDTEAYREGNASARALVDIGGCRSLLTVALRKDDALLGALSVYREGIRPFSDKQIALLQNFAAQAVIAMENARLITETREALEQQTATAEVLQVINSSPGDLAPVFDAILEKAHSLCGCAQGTLELFDGEYFRAAATRNVPQAVAERLRRGLPAAENPMGRPLLAGEPFFHVADIAELDEPVARISVRRQGRHTIMSVALRKGDALLGMIVASRLEVRPFTDKEIALLQNFAAQAVIAMENARLLTETREALDQQTATAEVLQVINSFPGNLAPVFDAMLEKALDLCDAAFGMLWTYDGERLNAVAMRGVPDEYTVFAREPLLPGRQTGLGRILHGENLVHIADISDDEVYRSGDRLRVATVELGGARTLLVVPLRKDGALLGVFTIYRQEVRPFSDKQIALLQNFAAQAVIAMENARLLTETREALDQQTATAEVLQVINSSPGDLTPVFEAMLDRAMRLCEAAFGILWTYDGEWLQAAAIRGATAAYADFLTSAPHKPGAENAHGRLLGGERFVQIADAEADAAYQSHDPLRRATVEFGGARTLLAVPLRKDGVFLSDVVIYRRHVQLFSEKQIALLQSFAAQAVIAIENARLLGELRERTHDLEESLEYQTATSDVLEVISRSTFDLQPVLDTVVETAARLCDAEMGLISNRDGDVYRVAGGLAGIRGVRKTADLHARPRQHHRAGRSRTPARAGHRLCFRSRTERPRSGGDRQNRIDARCAIAARSRADRRHWGRPPAGRGLYRAAGRAGPHLCRPGSDRDRKYAVIDRTA